jgi:DNA polymerase-3 subunit epsilon
MELRLERPLVFLDLETTGLDVERDRIVEIGLVRLHADGRREEWVERVDPGVDIPEAATRVHGIRTDDVRGLFGRPRLARLANVLQQQLDGADLGGFNSTAYDIPLFLAECRRHQIPFTLDGRHQIDVKVVFHAKETTWDRFLMGPRNLSAAVRLYCGRELDGAHSAGADASATVDVLLEQLKRYPDLPRTVPELAAWCRESARRIDASRQTALREG